MATHVLAEVLEYSRAKYGDLLVIIVLADEAGKDTREARCSIDLIMRHSKLSVRAVHYSLRKLEAMGEISILSQRGRGQFSKYRVNNLPALKGAKSAPFTESENLQSAIGKPAEPAPFSRHKTCKLRPENLQSEPDTLFRISHKTDMAHSRPVYPDEFEHTWKDYPQRLGGNPKRAAYRAWQARRKEGHTVEEIHGGTSRYARYCQRRGLVNTEYVMQTKRFMGPEKEFQQPWSTQAPKPAAKSSAPERPQISEAEQRRINNERYNERMRGLGRPEKQVPVESTKDTREKGG